MVVVDKAGSANLIPWFELFGTLPAAILMTWGLTKLLKRYSIASVFYTTTIAFLSFFLLYCFVIHPLHFFETTPYLKHIPSLLFFVVSELWKVILLSVLFWGFLNRHLLVDEAKPVLPPFNAWRQYWRCPCRTYHHFLHLKKCLVLFSTSFRPLAPCLDCNDSELSSD